MTMISRRSILTMAAAVAAVGPLRAAGAATTRVSTGKDGAAIQGFDTHAYWAYDEPRRGLQAHVVHWNDTPWQFGSAEEAAMFAAAPEQFTPQFGGFCTRAMSLKKVVDGDPEVWRIYQDKLYLFAKPVGLRYFNRGEDAMIAKAQAYWDTLD